MTDQSRTPADRGPKQRIGVLDLGSTSFHLVIADASPTGEIDRVNRRRVMNRLAEVLATKKKLPKAEIRDAEEVCKELLELARQESVEVLLPVATAAVRESANAKKIVAHLSKVLEQPVRVLSGIEEARLIFASFERRLQWGDARVLALDLGGGSLEVALGHGSTVEWEDTLSLGTARLASLFVSKDPMRKKSRAAIAAHVKKQLKTVRAKVDEAGFDLAAATGGTMGALTRLLMQRSPQSNAEPPGVYRVKRSHLKELEKELVASKNEERLAMPAMSVRRSDLLPTGAVILATVCRELGIKSLTHSDWGLREGVILEYLGLIDGAGS